MDLLDSGAPRPWDSDLDEHDVADRRVASTGIFHATRTMLEKWKLDRK